MLAAGAFPGTCGCLGARTAWGASPTAASRPALRSASACGGLDPAWTVLHASGQCRNNTPRMIPIIVATPNHPQTYYNS